MTSCCSYQGCAAHLRREAGLWRLQVLLARLLGLTVRVTALTLALQVCWWQHTEWACAGTTHSGAGCSSAIPPNSSAAASTTHESVCPAACTSMSFPLSAATACSKCRSCMHQEPTAQLLCHLCELHVWRQALQHQGIHHARTSSPPTAGEQGQNACAAAQRAELCAGPVMGVRVCL